MIARWIAAPNKGRKPMTRCLGIAILIVAALSAPMGVAARPSVAQDLQCSDLASQSDAQTILDSDPSGPNHLDPDGDGIACEALPPDADDKGNDPAPPTVAGDADLPDRTTEGKVVSITDGDTIKVKITEAGHAEEGETVTVRLIGIDTPVMMDPRNPDEPYLRKR